jgi:hypothetical protein
MNTLARSAVCLFLLASSCGAVVEPLPATPGQDTAQDARQRPTGVGFLIGQGTMELIPLLNSAGDFLELVLGPDKIRYVRELALPAKAMCVEGSLDGVARSVALLEAAGIEPSRVYIAYNPEPRPPGAPQWTQGGEVDDLPGSLRQARALLGGYPAELVMGPGLMQMANQEHLYPELARLTDIWMIQSQRLQADPATGRKATPAEYRKQVQRIVDMLRAGNPKIRVFIQIIPLTQVVTTPYTAEEVADLLFAVEDLVESVKIYGGDTNLIREVIERVRRRRAVQ